MSPLVSPLVVRIEDKGGREGCFWWVRQMDSTPHRTYSFVLLLCLSPYFFLSIDHSQHPVASRQGLRNCFFGIQVE